MERWRVRHVLSHKAVLLAHDEASHLNILQRQVVLLPKRELMDDITIDWKKD